MVTLTAGALTVTLAPETGGAIASFTHDGRAIFRPVTDPNLLAQADHAMAAYPLVPFSNRVGYGRFTWDGTPHQLGRNFDDEPHTIHGNGWMRPWTVDAATAHEARLSLTHAPPDDPASEWPFSYCARQLFRLDGTSLEITIGLTNTGDVGMPAALGLHPYVAREPGTTLQFGAEAVWKSGANALPEALLPVDGHWDYRTARPIAGPKIDDCYAGWDGTVQIGWPERAETLTIFAPPSLRHLVLYTPENRDYFGIEPVSNMTDAVNHPELAENGTVALPPGGHLEATIRFALGRR